MALSVYVHIPYCLQRCRYCDFATFELGEVEGRFRPADYADWVRREIGLRRGLWSETEIATLYYGGGTPSLLAPELIVAIRLALANAGFRFTPDCETTIEINPATLDEANLNTYLENGFNRFSVGAQTFNDALLKVCGRKHTAGDTRETLRLLRKYGVNYSFDLLFALPGQSLAQLREDLIEVADFEPPHLSPYCLTVPSGHPMSTGRAPEGEQVAMFELIEKYLAAAGLEKYEISNFARPGFESRHNLAYWTDASYWGVGLSSHSYKRDQGPYGMRFWNTKSLAEYREQGADIPGGQREELAEHESLTDFCHTSLRLKRGLSRRGLEGKFRGEALASVRGRLARLCERGWLKASESGWRLTSGSELISNQVFSELTFLRDEILGPKSVGQLAT
jgi:oxygen-independent coproporphyrinogen-3 oxidase